MFSIGEFATLGRVSIRMLRHYDAIGLLPPAHVDALNGYRFYEAGQLRRLNRIIALKDLGFTLEQVREIIDATIDTSELRGMLRLRRAELAGQLAADADRLSRVEARLQMIEREGAMSKQEVTVKQVEPIEVGYVSGVAKSSNHEDIGPVVSQLFDELFGSLHGAGIQLSGPPLATYTPVGDGQLDIKVATEVPSQVDIDGIVIDRLSGVAEAACYLHEGTMDRIGEGYQALATWIEDHGYRTDGTAREVYLVSYPEPQERWRTELQMPISAS